MVIAKTMEKPTLKVSMSDSDSSEEEESETCDLEESVASDDAENTDQDDVASDPDNTDQDDVASDPDNEITEENNETDNSDADIESSGDENDALITNEGWGDSVAKILGSKKPKNKKTLVLSRAKKHSETVKTEKDVKPDFEVIGDSEDVKPDVKVETDASAEPPVKRKKHEKASLRVKPNILEKDRERLLSKIATKGVVQLFNAVRNQQKSMEKQVERNDLTEAKKEKIIKKFDKRTFLDTLMGNTKSIVVDDSISKPKDEVKDEDKPTWKALRDDFMMGAKMKDWDKESVDE